LFLGNVVLLPSCASLEYQNPDTVARLDEMINQAPQARKYAARVTIERILEGVQSLSKSSTSIQNLPHSPIRFGFSATDTLDGKLVFTNITAEINESGNCKVLYQGGFGASATAAFIKAVGVVKSYPCQETLVKLSSNGGNMMEGIRVGLIIRQNKWSTLAWKDNSRNTRACVSSCAIAFLGGRNRYSHSNNFMDFSDAGHLFFHQIGAVEEGNKKCIDNPQELQPLIVYEYFKEVLPDASTLMLGKLLDESCKTADSAVTLHELLEKHVNTSRYTTEIYNRFK